MGIQVTKTDYLTGKMINVIDEEDPSRFLVSMERKGNQSLVRLYENQNLVLTVKQSRFLQNIIKCTLGNKVFKVMESFSQDKVYRVIGSAVRFIANQESKYTIYTEQSSFDISVETKAAQTTCFFDANNKQYLMITMLLISSML